MQVMGSATSHQHSEAEVLWAFRRFAAVSARPGHIDSSSLAAALVTFHELVVPCHLHHDCRIVIFLFLMPWEPSTGANSHESAKL